MSTTSASHALHAGHNGRADPSARRGERHRDTETRAAAFGLIFRLLETPTRFGHDRLFLRSRRLSCQWRVRPPQQCDLLAFVKKKIAHPGITFSTKIMSVLRSIFSIRQRSYAPKMPGTIWHVGYVEFGIAQLGFMFST